MSSTSKESRTCITDVIGDVVAHDLLMSDDPETKVGRSPLRDGCPSCCETAKLT